MKVQRLNNSFNRFQYVVILTILDLSHVDRSKNGVCECAECGEWFSSADLYQQHVATHDGKFFCIISGTVFKTSEMLEFCSLSA